MAAVTHPLKRLLCLLKFSKKKTLTIKLTVTRRTRALPQRTHRAEGGHRTEAGRTQGAVQAVCRARAAMGGGGPRSSSGEETGRQRGEPSEGTAGLLRRTGVSRQTAPALLTSVPPSKGQGAERHDPFPGLFQKGLRSAGGHRLGGAGEAGEELIRKVL